MTKEICNPEYLAKALLLKAEEKERLLSRMSGKLPRRLAKEKLTVDEALAIQLEIEDEQLAEWREKMHAIKAKEAAKDQKKKKAEEKTANVAAEKPAKAEKKDTIKPAVAAPKTAKPAKPAAVAQKAPAAAKTVKPKAKAAPKAAVTKPAAKRRTS